jgi:hypothetical protein
MRILSQPNIVVAKRGFSEGLRVEPVEDEIEGDGSADQKKLSG